LGMGEKATEPELALGKRGGRVRSRSKQVTGCKRAKTTAVRQRLNELMPKRQGGRFGRSKKGERPPRGRERGKNRKTKISCNGKKEKKFAGNAEKGGWGPAEKGGTGLLRGYRVVRKSEPRTTQLLLGGQCRGFASCWGKKKKEGEVDLEGFGGEILNFQRTDGKKREWKPERLNVKGSLFRAQKEMTPDRQKTGKEGGVKTSIRGERGTLGKHRGGVRGGGAKLK